MGKKIPSPLPDPVLKPHSTMEFDLPDEKIGDFGEVPGLQSAGKEPSRGKAGEHTSGSGSAVQDAAKGTGKGDTPASPDAGAVFPKDFEDDFDYRISDSDDFDIE